VNVTKLDIGNVGSSIKIIETNTSWVRCQTVDVDGWEMDNGSSGMIKKGLVANNVKYRIELLDAEISILCC
jgi:hypothetical protein